MITPKLIQLFSPVIAVLWVAGGYQCAWIRDIFLPVLIGCLFWNRSGDPLLGVLTAGCFLIVRLGYGNYDPDTDPKPSLLAKLTKDRHGAIIRAIYGLIVGIVGLAAYVAITRHYWLALTYTATLSTVCFIVVRMRLNVFWTDVLIGLAVSGVTLLKF